MKFYELHQLCVDLCKNIINSQVSDGSEIKYLLPVKYIINDWSMYDSVEWVNPITKEEFIEPFNSEDTRQRAIHNINEQISLYNDEVDRLDSQYKDLEERDKKQLHRKRSPYDMYTLTAWMHNPVHGQLPDKRQKTAFDARHFNNKKVYERILQCETDDIAVGKFNRMIYEYIVAATEGMQLVETSTFYYPKLEFEDYMARSQWSYPSLLKDDGIGWYDVYKSPFKDSVYHSGVVSDFFPNGQYWDYDKLFKRAQREMILMWRDESGENHSRFDKEGFKESLPKFDISHYSLTIDLDKKTLYFENRGIYFTKSHSDIEVGWKECGLEGKGEKPNRFMALLIKYAYYNEQTEGLPPIEKANRWDEMVKSTYRENTFYRYQKGLKNTLEKLLLLPPDVGLFEKQTEKIEQRSSKGKKETVEFEYYETGIGIKLKEVPENLRETGYYTEGLEQWSSDIDGDFNGHED